MYFERVVFGHLTRSLVRGASSSVRGKIETERILLTVSHSVNELAGPGSIVRNIKL